MTNSRFREMNKLLKEVEYLGCSVEFTRKNHFKVKTPSGRIVICPGTASDFRAIRNAKSELRKAGVAVR